MTSLPKDIKEQFYDTIKGDISIYDFEQWLYEYRELESYLKPDDYFDLIALNFNASGAKHELIKLLNRHIDITDFETYRLLGLLNLAKRKNKELPYVLMEFYNLYCKGYYFLNELGLGYGLRVEVPSNANSWGELSKPEQEESINSISSGLDEYVDRVVNWIETQKVVLKGFDSESGYLEYIDNRTDEEKESLLFKTVDKKWWEFWK